MYIYIVYIYIYIDYIVYIYIYILYYIINHTIQTLIISIVYLPCCGFPSSTEGLTIGSNSYDMYSWDWPTSVAQTALRKSPGGCCTVRPPVYLGKL